MAAKAPGGRADCAEAHAIEPGSGHDASTSPAAAAPSSPSPPAAVAARCTCAARPRACPVPTCRFDPLGAAALHATTGSPAIELSACLSLITHPPERRSTVRRNSSRHSSLSPLSAHAKRTHAKNVHATLLANTRVCARANRDLMSLSVGRARRLLQHGNPMENPTEPRDSHRRERELHVRVGGRLATVCLR